MPHRHWAFFLEAPGSLARRGFTIDSLYLSEMTQLASGGGTTTPSTAGDGNKYAHII